MTIAKSQQCHIYLKCPVRTCIVSISEPPQDLRHAAAGPGRPGLRRRGAAPEGHPFLRQGQVQEAPLPDRPEGDRHGHDRRAGRPGVRHTLGRALPGLLGAAFSREVGYFEI